MCPFDINPIFEKKEPMVKEKTQKRKIKENDHNRFQNKSKYMAKKQKNNKNEPMETTKKQQDNQNKPMETSIENIDEKNDSNLIDNNKILESKDDNMSEILHSELPQQNEVHIRENNIMSAQNTETVIQQNNGTQQYNIEFHTQLKEDQENFHILSKAVYVINTKVEDYLKSAFYVALKSIKLEITIDEIDKISYENFGNKNIWDIDKFGFMFKKFNLNGFFINESGIRDKINGDQYKNIYFWYNNKNELFNMLDPNEFNNNPDLGLLGQVSGIKESHNE
jgi:hypothetical protein